MELEQLFIGDIYKITDKNELEQSFDAIKVKETILYRKGYIDTKYIDLKTREIYTGDYNNLRVGESFINEYTLKPYKEILLESEKEKDQSIRNVLVRYRRYRQTTKK